MRIDLAWSTGQSFVLTSLVWGSLTLAPIMPVATQCIYNLPSDEGPTCKVIKYQLVSIKPVYCLTSSTPIQSIQITFFNETGLICTHRWHVLQGQYLPHSPVYSVGLSVEISWNKSVSPRSLGNSSVFWSDWLPNKASSFLLVTKASSSLFWRNSLLRL